MNSEEKRREALKASGCIPRHIAIIMDGNGRWAKSKGFPRIAGHQEGVKTVRHIVEVCAELGVEYLTLYTFSTENWNRPKEEVSTLMRLLLRTLRKEINDLNKNNIRLSTIGDIDQLPDRVREEFLDAFEKTKNNSRMQLILALSYSGRWEITEAVKKIAADVKEGKISTEEVNNSLFEEYLTTSHIPDPDLLIRTGGEYRVSNFLLWQIAYTEFFISDVYWPEFKSKHLYDAIASFQHRERRFGKVSEQIKKKKKDLI
ncbi:MAG: isoprenyl transferase [Ignavibacteriaceae bacterium]|nr:isoprenyl transferase [Ignavibacteriaceae bacterium]